MLSEIAKVPNLYSDIHILAYSKNVIFMAVDKPDFRERQAKNKAKTGKCPISQGFE